MSAREEWLLMTRVPLCICVVGLALVSLLVLAANAQRQTWPELNAEVARLQQQGRYAAAVDAGKGALEFAERSFGPEHANVAASLYCLGDAYKAQGQYTQAEPLYRRGVTICEKIYGTDHPSVAIGLSKLGDVYEAGGQYANAEPLLKRSLAICEKALGSNHMYVANALSSIGRLYLAEGQYKQAQPIYERVLAIREKAFGLEHPDVAVALNDLAGVYRVEKQDAKAEALFKRALAVREKALGPEHPDVAGSLNNLALLYYSQGRLAEAESLFSRALTAFEKSLGPDHPNVATTLNNLAVLYKDQGEYARADPLLKRALSIFEKTFGPEHSSVATTLDSLGALYFAEGHYEQAEPFCTRALTIREKVLGPEHPDVAVSRKNLADLRSAQARTRAAAALNAPDGNKAFNTGYSAMQKGLDLGMRMFDDPLGVQDDELGAGDSAEMLLLASARMKAIEGKLADAESLYKRVLARKDVDSGARDVRLAAVLREYGGLLSDMGKSKEAETTLRRAVSICEQPGQTNRQELARSLRSLAVGLLATAKYADAETNLLRAIEIMTEERGPDDEQVAKFRADLDIVRAKIGINNDPRAELRESLLREERQWGRDSHKLAAPLTTLATAEMRAGNNATAEALLKRALDIMSVHEANMATLHTKKGSEGQGLSHPEIVPVLLSLGALYASNQRYDESEAMLRRALDASRQAYGPEHENVADALSALGAVAYCEGKSPELIESLYSQALAIRQKALGPQHPDVASLLCDIALLKARTGRCDESLHLLEGAIAIQRKTLRDVFSFCSEKERLSLVDNLAVTRSMFFSLCVNKLGTKGSAAGLEYLIKWKSLVLDSMMEDAEAARLSADPALRQRADRLRETKTQLASLALAGPGKLTGEQYQAKIAALQTKAEELERDIARQSAVFREAQASLNVELSDVAAALPGGSVLVEFAKYLNYDFSAKGAEDAFTDSRYVAFVLRAGETNPVLVDLGSGVKICAAVLGYQDAMKPRLASETNKVTLALGGLFRDALLNTFATSLYGRVWAPIESSIHGAKQLFLSPDADLNFVSFAGLRDPEGRYVLEDYDISYVSSGRDLVRGSLRDAGAERNAVLFGVSNFSESAMSGPAFDTAPRAARFRSDIPLTGPLAGLHFPRLANAVAEVEHIASLASGVGVQPRKYLQSFATEAHVKGMGRPAILHFATHGFFLPAPDLSETVEGVSPFERSVGLASVNLTKGTLSNPMQRSGLALAGANLTLEGKAKEGEEDGILTAEEVAGLDLEGTELVVLSACETGLGEIEGGEGVLGLRRAFVRAGAENLVMALWQVPDVETRVLMEAFYAKYLSGLSPAQALLEAQREALAEERKDHRGHNPYAWAAFVASGIGSSTRQPAKDAVSR